ncbi:energy transducer TonB [Colwellia sp. MEBiC06753]
MRYALLAASFLCPLIYSACSVAAVTNQTSELSKHISTIVGAIPTERVPPKYPTTEARRGYDGWVQLSFIVEPDGATSNIIVEDSSGRKGFEKEAVKAVKQWQYQPALDNGQPIQQCENSVQLDFKMHRKSKGVTRRFYQVYQELTQAIAQKDQTLAKDKAEVLRNYEIYSQSESYFLYATLAEYYQFIGDSKLQLESLENAFRFSGASRYLKLLGKLSTEEGVKIERATQKANETLQSAGKRIPAIQRDMPLEKKLNGLLHAMLMLYLGESDINKALQAAKYLQLLSVNSEHHAVYHKQELSLIRFIESDQQLVTNGKITERGFWQHRLLRSSFGFSHVNGNLSRLDVRCQNSRHLYTFSEQSQWTIPDTWQSCNLYVFGEQGASFELLEVN